MEITAENDSTVFQSAEDKLKKEIKQLREKLEVMKKRVNRFLRPDQICYLQRMGTTNPYTWTNQTIRHALQIKCAVDNKGYEFLRSIDYPLPSSRTLSRRIESCRISQGIQYDIIKWLGIKLQLHADQSKLCVLSLDEMQLRPFVEYDKGFKKYVGFVNVKFNNSDEPELATHALVFVVRGLTLHWKQVVAYALTGNSINLYKLWDFVKKLIMCLDSHGLLVKYISSDMGSNNTGLWGVVGVHSIRNHVNCRIPHPSKPEENLYFVADIPHILKNIRNCLLSQDIILSENNMNEKNFKSNIVSMKHVECLVELHEVGGPVLVPNLTKKIVIPSAFEKMRVPIAKSLFSSKVSSALTFCISTGIMSEDAAATAWFIEQINKWYEIMLSRDKIDALSKNSTDKFCCLRNMLHWFLSLSFNGKRHWKPIQTGLQLSTTSAMELCQELCSRGLVDYLLTSRLSTDCVENFFAQVHQTGDNHPTPVKLRNVIRLISVAQYSHVPYSSSYDDDDDDEYYLEFFSKTQPVKEMAEYEPRFTSDVNINTLQEAGLYYINWVDCPQTCSCVKENCL